MYCHITGDKKLEVCSVPIVDTADPLWINSSGIDSLVGDRNKLSKSCLMVLPLEGNL